MTASEINELFKTYGRTLGSVESFTGGLFAREITRVQVLARYLKVLW